MVSFANSENGGTILIGIDERKLKNGLIEGKVVGCSVSDSEITAIYDIAGKCSPMLQIEVIVENTMSKPIIRIEIPSGSQKPYCSQGGRYTIRNGCSTSVLDRNLLLKILENQEGARFLSKGHSEK